MILCFVLFLVAVAACLIAGYSLVWAILFGLVVFFTLGLRRGYSASALTAMAWKKGKSALIVVPVFLMIGTVTGLVASANINIENMVNQSRNGYAYTVLDVAAKPSEALLDKLDKLETVYRVRLLMPAN